MGLYNREPNRTQYQSSDFDKRTITDSEVIHLYHDREPEIEETVQSTTMWNPVDRKIYGYLDCSNNPPFPEAYAGQMYIIQVSGTVGGYSVSSGDSIECVSQYSAEGYGELVKSRWLLMRANASNTNLVIENRDDIQERVQELNGSFVDLGVLESNTIIRRAMICIKKEYPNDSKFVFNIGDTSVSIDVESCIKGDILEDLRGFYVKKESELRITVPDYQYGSASIVVEYYPVKEENSLKTLRIDLSREMSSDFFVPKNSIISSVTIVPIEPYNKEAILTVYLNEESLLSGPIEEIYTKYLFNEISDNSPIRAEIENYLKGKMSILIEYNMSKTL